jgi:hypothetical protein
MYVNFKARGEDWLTYEHFARQILITRSLEGGESVFYYQPGFRYILFGLHLVFGDGAWGVAFSFTLLLLLPVFLLTRRIAQLAPSESPFVSRWIPRIFVAGAVSMIVSPSILELVSWHASEIPTWGLLAFAYFLITGPQSMLSSILISLIAGLNFVIRPNQLVVSLMLVAVAVSLSSRQRAIAASSMVPFIAIAALPTIHNLYYGRKFIILPTGSETVRDLSVSELLFFPWVEPARGVLLEKFTRIFNPTMFTGEQGELSPQLLVFVWPLVIFGAVWLMAVWRLRSLKAKSAALWLVLLIPLGFLPTMVLYDVDIYYPRHVVAFVLSIGMSGITTLALAGRLRTTPPHALMDDPPVSTS